MRFTLTIDMDNDAFEARPGNYGHPELVRILQNVAERVPGEDEGSVRDINGNTVGSYSITGDRQAARRQARRRTAHRHPTDPPRRRRSY